MSDGWGHDTFDDFADGFDEGFGRGPEGFSDFQEDWAPDDGTWQDGGPMSRFTDAGALESTGDDSFVDSSEEFTHEEGTDEWDFEWAAAGADLEEFTNRDDQATLIWEAEDPADDPTWEDSGGLPGAMERLDMSSDDSLGNHPLPGDGEDRRADDEDEGDEYRDKRL